jgi:hypothetical protein
VTIVKKKTAVAKEATTDTFVPDRVARAELSISHMTAYRWDHDPAMAKLGWPPAIRVGAQSRKYRSRKQLELFKQNMVTRAIATRGGRA